MSVACEQTEESEETIPSRRLFDRKGKYLQDQAYGFICCLISVFWYCISFMCIRLMTDYSSISSDWTLFFKESVMVFLALSCILWKICKGTFRFPCRHVLGLIILAAFFCEFLGSRPHLWAFAAIGILLASPLVQAFQIIGTTIVGMLWFKETLSGLKILAIVILIAAISFLSLGQSGSSDKPETSDLTKIVQSGESSVDSLDKTPNGSLSDSFKDSQNNETRIEVDSEIITVNETESVDEITTNLKVDVHDEKTEANAVLTETAETTQSFCLAWGILTTFIAGLGYTFYISLLRGIMKEATRPTVALSAKAADNSFQMGAGTCLENGLKADSASQSINEASIKAESGSVNQSTKTLDYGTAPVAAIMFLMPLVGVIVFGSCLISERGISGFYSDIPAPCWGIVLSSGLANVLAFFFKVESLRYISGSKMSLVAVTQTLTLVLIGMFLFKEPVNSFVWLGVILTIIGVFLTGKTK